MWHKRYSVVFLMLFASSILLSSISSGHAWSKPEMIVPGSTSAPQIDGIKDDLWAGTTVNVTYHTFPTRNSPISLSATTNGGYVYILIETNFISNQQNETISLYLGSTNQTTDNDTVFFDKKMITFFNATQFGNESSAAVDFYRTDAGNYSADEVVDAFKGAAKFANEARNPRIYEFAIPLTALNASYDITWIMGKNYALKVGINNSLTDEEISVPILLQLGPRLGFTEGGVAGEYKFDTVLYLKIVMVVIAVIYGIVGVVIVV